MHRKKFKKLRYHAQIYILGRKSVCGPAYDNLLPVADRTHKRTNLL